MKIILNSTDLKKELKNNHNLGFVPTMGSIHKGHESLILRSKKECKSTLISIFVNPTQFNSKKDLNSYPRNIKRDLSILKKLNVDYVFIPRINDIYCHKRKKKIKLIKSDLVLCAKFRKGHFEGVLDVMDRLINLVSPNKIFMGEKDYQQYHLVKKFIKYRYKTKIVMCSTVRSANKIALSSRNFSLNKNYLLTAGKIVKELLKTKEKISRVTNVVKYLDSIKKYLTIKYKIKIQYLELRNINNLKKSNALKNSKIFIAFYLGKVRLIDNL